MADVNPLGQKELAGAGLGAPFGPWGVGAGYAGGLLWDLFDGDSGGANSNNAQAAAAANAAAGQRAAEVGTDAADMYQQSLGRALEQTDPAARYFNKNYEGEGALAGPGQLENRYTDVRNSIAGGTDPVSSQQRLEGAKSIADAFGARGLQNSGAALRAQANLERGINADTSHRLDSLAQGAQGATSTRIGGGFDRLNSLGQGRANIVMNGSAGGIDAYSAGQMGGIAGNLNAANVGYNANNDQRKADAAMFGYAAPKIVNAFLSPNGTVPTGGGGDSLMTPTQF